MSQSAVPSSPLSGDDTDRQLASGLRLLRLVSPLTLIPYLPPILTHVLALLAWPSQQREAFNSLIDLLHSVYLDATGSALTLATSYAEYVAMPSPQLCEDIVRLWSDAIRSLDPNSVRACDGGAFARSPWRCRRATNLSSSLASGSASY